MPDQSFIRRFEFLIVLAGISAYVVRSLFSDALRFESMIKTARLNGVPVNSLLADLSHYDHTNNHNLPVIASAVLFFAAWYVFHYMFYPGLKPGKFGLVDSALLLTVVALCATSAFVVINTIHVNYRYTSSGLISGLKDVSNFRKLYVVSDSVAILSIICFYEVIAQIYYKVREKLTGDSRGQIFHYLTLISVCIIFFIGVISQRLIPHLLFAKGPRQFLTFILYLMLLALLQEYYFRKVIPIRPKNSPLYLEYATYLIYAFLCILGGLLIWLLMLRFPHNTTFTLIFATTLLFGPAMMIAYWRQSLQNLQLALRTQVTTQSAKLSNLRSQINPHFLFNALNSLYATALKENSVQTAEGIQKLGDIMRFMLDENNRDMIPLQQEIAYLHNYIDIQNMRLDKSQQIEVRVHLQETEQEIYIAPMLLNPFIENAFKHGISFQYPSWIYITLSLDSEKLFFKVHNSLHKFQGLNTEESTGGIGLENVRQRLELIYPQRHSLEVQQSERDFFIALTLIY